MYLSAACAAFIIKMKRWWCYILCYRVL